MYNGDEQEATNGIEISLRIYLSHVVYICTIQKTRARAAGDSHGNHGSIISWKHLMRTYLDPTTIDVGAKVPSHPLRNGKWSGVRVDIYIYILQKPMVQSRASISWVWVREAPCWRRPVGINALADIGPIDFDISTLFDHHLGQEPSSFGIHAPIDASR